VQLARVTVVQQAGEFLALGLPPLHNAQAVEHGGAAQGVNAKASTPA
jgi:hypothetical protein